jgi:transcriptional regulator with XRE-family HTH domain
MQLRQYLTKRNIPIPAFAERIGVSTQAVHRYLTGERMPRRDVMERIKVETGGAVQPNDFFCPAEAAA